jgi:hypothetical protein
MYKVPVEVRESDIDGKGVFAKSDIKKHVIVWQYIGGYDKKMTQYQFDSLEESTKTELQRIAYLSPTTNLWVMPPEDDPACYTNHDPEGFNTSVVFDKDVSDEPIFVANRDIEQGEEITNNYLEFDKNSAIRKFEWLKS